MRFPEWGSAVAQVRMWLWLSWDAGVPEIMYLSPCAHLVLLCPLHVSVHSVCSPCCGQRALLSFSLLGLLQFLFPVLSPALFPRVCFAENGGT